MRTGEILRTREITELGMIVELKCKKWKREMEKGRVGRGQKDLKQVVERRGEND